MITVVATASGVATASSSGRKLMKEIHTVARLPRKTELSNHLETAPGSQGTAQNGCIFEVLVLTAAYRKS